MRQRETGSHDGARRAGNQRRGDLAEGTGRKRCALCRLSAVAPVTYEHQPPSWAGTLLREALCSPKGNVASKLPESDRNCAIFAMFALILP